MNLSAPETAPAREIELSGDYPGIRFEPGKHITSSDQYSQVLAQLASGNLNASIWNPEVATRISSYSPALLTIDGQSPVSQKVDKLAYSPDFKRLLWTNMPARPQRLNTTGQIYTISADVTAYNDYLQSLADTNTPEGEQLSKMYAAVLKQLETTEKTKGGLGTMVDSVLILTMGMLIARATATAVATASELKTMKEMAKPKVSRREFLRLTGITTFGLLLAFAHAGTAIASTLESPMSTTEEGKQFWLNVIDVIRPRFIKSQWVNTRTALLIAKTQDTLDFLGLPQNTLGSVVMGPSHNYEANTLIKSAVERERAISGWTTNLVTSLDNLLEREGLMSLRQSARNALLDYVTSVEVFNINDPQGPDLNPNFSRMIDYYVVPTGRFYSPRVEAAVHHLRI